MESEQLDAPGQPAEAHDLQTAKAKDLVALLKAEEIEFVSLVECRRDDDSDVVVVEVEVEVGQLRKHRIEPLERLAIVFETQDSKYPEVLALRQDFPQVPHLNLRWAEVPRSLCLYEQSYDEVRHLWTPSKFIERIRQWLALTAKGKLHDKDQPLEPLLWGCAGQIVLPDDMLSRGDAATRELVVSASSLESFDLFLIADDTDKAKAAGLPYYVVSTFSPPRPHGIIRFRPKSLHDLAAMVDTTDYSLLSVIRSSIEESKDALASDPKKEAAFLSASLIVLLGLPKTREEGGEVETTDIWAFLTTSSIRQVGLDTGLWMEIDGYLGKEPSAPESKTGLSVGLDLLNPRFAFSQEAARRQNGFAEPQTESTIAAIGAGALGSQVLLNSQRMGLKFSTVIDEDRLLPHNLARHVLTGNVVGMHKSECIATLMNDIYDSSDVQSIQANVLRPRECAEELQMALAESELILDMSASVAVARWLAGDVSAKARRVSMFMNPSGSDFVALYEDEKRTCPIDMLEMQYYRALVHDERLESHFVPTKERQRYGQSCRDISARLPTDKISIHAGIAARCLKNIVESHDAGIGIWRLTEDMECRMVKLTPSPCVQLEIGDWTVKIDEHVVDLLISLRDSKLPNETGGVLIGSFDLRRKIAYVVDSIPSPPDSEEWPTLYIRGSKGLRKQVEAINKKTDGALQYIGEWHSHPNGCSTLPSDDDMQVFAWLTDRMRADGYPGLVMIAGENRAVNCFVGEIKRVENLFPLMCNG